MSLLRGFIAVETDISSAVSELAAALRDSGSGITIVKSENLHLTLKFMGDTPHDSVETITDAVKETLRGISPFYVEFRSTGYFSDRNRIRVIWIGINDSGILSEISGRINTALEPAGFPREERDFTPHLTIARVKDTADQDKIVQTVNRFKDTLFEIIKVERVKLIKSELRPAGPVYTTLREFHL